MEEKNIIMSSLSKLLNDLGKSKHNIFISIGADTELRDLTYYENLQSTITNDYPSVLIFFSKLDDFSQDILPRLKGDELLKKYEPKHNLKNFSIYIIPYYLPILSAPNLEDILFFIKDNRVTIKNETDETLKLEYRSKTLTYEKINLNNCIDSFISEEFIVLLTHYCLLMQNFGCNIILLDRWRLETRGWFGTEYMYAYSNIYLEKVIYLYPFIKLLKDNGNISLFLERNNKNYLSDFFEKINTVSNPKFFNSNFDYLTKDMKKDLKYLNNNHQTINNNDIHQLISFNLENNILTSNGSHIIQIPNNSFSTAFGSEWLNSYAIIIGINNVLKIFNSVPDDILVCIPEIQYNILHNGRESINELIRYCKILFIPINVSGLHWTLLMINLDKNVGYHIDSLPGDKNKYWKENDKNKYLKEKESRNKNNKNKYLKEKESRNKNNKKNKRKEEYNKELKIKEKNNYYISNEICHIILNRDVININLSDQYNDYDCGAFILLHLFFLVNGYIEYGLNNFNNLNIKNYMIDMTSNISNIDDEIKKIRQKIYILGENINTNRNNSNFKKRNKINSKNKQTLNQKKKNKSKTNKLT